jgi:hypothetical protein
MPAITLYVKDADTELVEKARKRLGDSLSSVFIDCVRKQLEELKPPRSGDLHKITLEVGCPPMRKSFEGRWILGDDRRGIEAEPDESGVQWNHDVQYSVALTKRGAVVVYEYEDGNEAGKMEIFDTFEDMKDTTMDIGYPRFPRNIIAETAAALGKSYEVELDI